MTGTLREQFEQGVEDGVRWAAKDALSQAVKPLGAWSVSKHPMLSGYGEARAVLDALVEEGQVERVGRRKFRLVVHG